MALYIGSSEVTPFKAHPREMSKLDQGKKMAKENGRCTHHGMTLRLASTDATPINKSTTNKTGLIGMLVPDQAVVVLFSRDERTKTEKKRNLTEIWFYFIAFDLVFFFETLDWYLIVLVQELYPPNKKTSEARNIPCFFILNKSGAIQLPLAPFVKEEFAGSIGSALSS